MAQMNPQEGTASLEELSRSDCLNLLATTTVGRIALIVDDAPQVFPVNSYHRPATTGPSVRTIGPSALIALLSAGPCLQP